MCSSTPFIVFMQQKVKSKSYQVGSKYSAHPNYISIKKSETDNLASFCFGFFLYSSLIFQSLIVRWVLSKLIPIFISRLPSA